MRRIAAARGREAEQAAAYQRASNSDSLRAALVRRIAAARGREAEQAADYENSAAPACSANSTSGCGMTPKKIAPAAAISAGTTR
jgi:hypothetical protein